MKKMKKITKEQKDMIRFVFLQIKGGTYDECNINLVYDMITDTPTDKEYKVKAIRQWYWSNYDKKKIKKIIDRLK
jgi:hypothetical protein